MYDSKLSWMWLPHWQEKDVATLVYFRGHLQLNAIPDSLLLQITADSRYKLYINGKLAEIGPSRGSDKIWYVDTVELAPYLMPGDNILAAAVLRYPYAKGKGNYGIFRTETPGLYVHTEQAVKWRCQSAAGYEIIPENPYFSPLMIYEKVCGQKSQAHWKEISFDDADWETPACYQDQELPRVLRPENLAKRTIPFLYRKQRRFLGVAGMCQDAWNALLTAGKPLTVPAHTTVYVDIDAGELMTGYLRLSMSGGAGAMITMLQSECYAGEIIRHADPYKSLPRKGNRTDTSLFLYGNTDTYYVAGFGSGEEPEGYEPYWFRTFRFIRLTVTTAAEPLTLLDFDYQETGYPLEIKTAVTSSDPSLDRIWEICERSLRRCMHETYEDCPFYEQMQYAMDARSEMLYTYASSGDDRLARKCMEDFSRSLRPDGMINCSAPGFEMNVIPGFGIYFVGMVYDHMMYFGDRVLVERHIGTVEAILDFFHRHLDARGLVEKVGDVNRKGKFWSFIDWTPGWDATDGVPPCTKYGPLTMESLLYILGLQYAALLMDYLGRKTQAEVYKAQAVQVQEAVNRNCVGKNGLYQDGPGIETYSQHCQVFAVLTDTTKNGRAILEETFEKPEQYEPCSVAMCYYLFRALEKAGLYRCTGRLWDIWRRMLADHLTTCPEDQLLSRSDCHAWGALALYELPAVILGVRPGKPGFEEVLVAPRTENLDWAEGAVTTPKGEVQVSWRKDMDGNIRLTAAGPKDIPIVIKK